MYRIVQLSSDLDYFGVYADKFLRGPYGTPMLFKGPFFECIAYRASLR